MRSEQLSRATLAVSLVALSVLAEVSAESNNLPPVRQKQSMLKTCIDDSDCRKIDPNNPYRCFMVRRGCHDTYFQGHFELQQLSALLRERRRNECLNLSSTCPFALANLSSNCIP
jgi:hypothetical protein